MAIKQLLILSMSLSGASIYCQEREYSISTSVFTPPGDFSLQMRSLDVPSSEILSEEIQSIIDQMFLVARGKREDTGENRVMVGLAAPQIGCSKRIILVDVGVDSDRKELGSLIAYINPEITWYSDEIVEGREGCYSVDSRIVGIVPRSERICIKALDRKGVPISEEFSGFTARIFQHEIDHLNGIRFPDRIGSEGALHWVEDQDYAEYKKEFMNWDCRCPWNTWIAMKNGDSFEAPVRDRR